MSGVPSGTVAAVSRNEGYAFSKPGRAEIVLIAGLGVEGDAHAGVTVRHRSRVAADPTQPNLRQVHLIHGELFDELRAAGYDVAPGQLGENVTTTGLDLLGLPRGTVLRFGIPPVVASVARVRARDRTVADPRPAVVVTGLRNPCAQINGFRPGLLKQVLGQDADGNVVRKAGVMAVVLRGGRIRPGDPVAVELPPWPHLPLERV
jgi:MOSC domain-containing protein YiiM